MGRKKNRKTYRYKGSFFREEEITDRSRFYLETDEPGVYAQEMGRFVYVRRVVVRGEVPAAGDDEAFERARDAVLAQYPDAAKARGLTIDLDSP